MIGSVRFGATAQISKELKKTPWFRSALQKSIDKHQADFEKLPESVKTVSFVQLTQPIYLTIAGSIFGAGPRIQYKSLFAVYEDTDKRQLLFKLPYQHRLGFLPVSKSRLDASVKAVIEDAKKLFGSKPSA